MAYKEIIVYLDPTPECDNRLMLAVDLAAMHQARLIGVNASSDAAEFNGPTHDKVVGLEAAFNQTIKRAGLRGLYREQYSPHYADLLVAPQPEFEARGMVQDEVPESALLTSGVPVLLLPYDWKRQPIGDNIVIAWKANREATRAVHDALPFLARAKKVTVFTFAPDRDVFGAEHDLMVGHLREHGITAQAATWPATGDMSPVEALFASVETQDADLIVAGAYGHSRFTEGLFAEPAAIWCASQRYRSCCLTNTPTFLET